MNSKSIELFRSADWVYITPQLTAYALMKVRRLSWNTAAQSLPEGQTPEDLVQKAVNDTLDGLLTDQTGAGFRKWNPETEPNLFDFLKGVIDSLVSNLVNTHEHRHTNYSANVSSEDAVEIFNRAVDGQTVIEPNKIVQNPEDLIVASETQEILEEQYQALREALFKPGFLDEDELLVFMAMDEIADSSDLDILPAKIIEVTGFNREQVKNIRKRLIRKAEQVKNDVLQKRGGSK